MKLKKIVFAILGTFFVILGSIGILLPILPTTPFLLLAAYFYLRSSKRLYEWLLNHKVFGKYVYHYVTYKSVPLKAKITATILIWITIPIATLLINNLYVYFILPIIAIIVTAYIFSLDTYKENT